MQQENPVAQNIGIFGQSYTPLAGPGDLPPTYQEATRTFPRLMNNIPQNKTIPQRTFAPTEQQPSGGNFHLANSSSSPDLITKLALNYIQHREADKSTLEEISKLAVTAYGGDPDGPCGKFVVHNVGVPLGQAVSNETGTQQNRDDQIIVEVYGDIKDQSTTQKAAELQQRSSFIKKQIFSLPYALAYDDKLDLYEKNVETLQKQLDNLHHRDTQQVSSDTKLNNLNTRFVEVTIPVDRISELTEIFAGNQYIEKFEINLTYPKTQRNQTQVLQDLQKLIVSLPNISEVNFKQAGSTIEQYNEPTWTEKIISYIDLIENSTPLGINLHNIKQLYALKQKYIDVEIDVNKSDIGEHDRRYSIDKIATALTRENNDLSLDKEGVQIHTDVINAFAKLRNNITEEISTKKDDLHRVLIKQCGKEIQCFIKDYQDWNLITAFANKKTYMTSHNIKGIEKAATLSVLLRSPAVKGYVSNKALSAQQQENGIIISALCEPTLENLLGNASDKIAQIILNNQDDISNFIVDTNEKSSFNNAYDVLDNVCKKQQQPNQYLYDISTTSYSQEQQGGAYY